MEYSEIFDGVNKEIEANQQIVDKFKDQVKLVDEGYRHVAKLIAPMHTDKPSSLSNIGTNVLHTQQFNDLKDVLTSLMGLVNQHPYYKYNGIWSHSLQNAVYIVLLAHWLSTKQLASPQLVAETLNLRIDSNGGNGQTNSGFDFTFEEYLHATISLINELSRLAVNSVTATAAANAQEPNSEAYDLPVEIDRFLKQVQAGFMALNLKNDSLRRRSDSIKYDVKKVEEIVYDLALRGLITRNT